MTDDEQGILDAFARCTPDMRRRALGYVRACADGHPSPTRTELLALARSRGLDVAAARVAIARAVGDTVYGLVVRA